MQSYALLLLVVVVLAVPGIGATLAVFPPGEASVVTRLAAAFGLGYAVSAGTAFLLAAAQEFRLRLSNIDPQMDGAVTTAVNATLATI